MIAKFESSKMTTWKRWKVGLAALVGGLFLSLTAPASTSSAIDDTPNQSGPTIPEPSSVLLFGIGSLVVGAALRKRARDRGF